MAHEQTSVAGPHLGAHGHPTDLVEDPSSKSNAFKVRTSSARRTRVAVGGWRDWGGLRSRKKDRAPSPSARGIEAVYSDSTSMVKISCGWKFCAVFMCSKRLRHESMSGILDVSGQGLHDGLKDEVQVFGNVFRGTTAGRDNGSTWGVQLMYFGQKVEGGLFSL